MKAGLYASTHMNVTWVMDGKMQLYTKTQKKRG